MQYSGRMDLGAGVPEALGALAAVLSVGYVFYMNLPYTTKDLNRDIEICTSRKLDWEIRKTPDGVARGMWCKTKSGEKVKP